MTVSPEFSQLAFNVAIAVIEQEQTRVAVLSAQNAVEEVDFSRRTLLGVHSGNLSRLLSVVRQCLRRMQDTHPFVYQYKYPIPARTWGH